MGRPPCCDKVGIKKGPWTPEEDIILVSYIQEHGPGNWRSVPTNTGLSRCSKSCRLRWTNYLRPGIKRGNFTPHEEGMIIHLQALLGNKWAAIASYLPQRTDNDIKNYWNTHLKKKLKKFQAALDPHLASSDHSSTTTAQFASKSFNDRRNNLDHISSNNINNHASSLRLISTTHQSQPSLSSSTTYASSTENISRLLEGWMRNSPKPETTTTQKLLKGTTAQDNNNKVLQSSNDHRLENSSKLLKASEGGDMVSHNNEEFESILSFENLNNGSAWDNSTCDSMSEKMSKDIAAELCVDHNNKGDDDMDIADENNNRQQRSENSGAPPLSFLEKWLLDENVGGQVEEMMELSPPIF